MDAKTELKSLTAAEVAGHRDALLAMIDQHVENLALEQRPLAAGYARQVIGALQTAARFAHLLSEEPAAKK
jgi:hypothetical protein